MADQPPSLPNKWVEAARYATEPGLTVYEANTRLAEFQRVVTPLAVLAFPSDSGPSVARTFSEKVSGDPALLSAVLRGRGRRNSLHDIERAADFLERLFFVTAERDDLLKACREVIRTNLAEEAIHADQRGAIDLVLAAIVKATGEAVAMMGGPPAKGAVRYDAYETQSAPGMNRGRGGHSALS